jgi:superfamily I DNA/RNA helicase
MASTFFWDFRRAPENVIAGLLKDIESVLVEDPTDDQNNKLIRLDDSSDNSTWRMDVSQGYVLIYEVETSDIENGVVTLLLLDRRINALSRSKTTCSDATSSVDAEIWSQYRPVTSSELDGIGIPQKYQNKISSATTVHELLSLDLSDDLMQQVIGLVSPGSLGEAKQEPARVLKTPVENLVKIQKHERTLESFLLDGDPLQRNLVSQLSKRSRDGLIQYGRRLINGGPGTGKTLIALYSALAIAIQPRIDRDERVLYVTYTHSLWNAARHMFNQLADAFSPDIKSKIMANVEIKRIDGIIGELATGTTKVMSRTEDKLLSETIEKFSQNPYKFPFSDNSSDHSFLKEEFEVVIEGNGLLHEKEYLDIRRVGRQRRPTGDRRRQIWTLYKEFTNRLENLGVVTRGQLRMTALDNAEPSYDHIFVDEAQDLTPVQIRTILNLCVEENRGVGNIAIISDPNQSIYSKSLSWTDVEASLNFKGRASTLKKNYRNSSQIWNAIKTFNPEANSEPISSETVTEGSLPVLISVDNFAIIGKRLNAFLEQAMWMNKVSPREIAVVCPTHRMIDQVIRQIDKKFHPVAVTSERLDLRMPGVKVMTMHTSKGLEFPIVVVVGAGLEAISYIKATDYADEVYAAAKSLRYVAMSRAMKSLGVFVLNSNYSEFISNTSSEKWTIQRD